MKPMVGGGLLTVEEAVEYLRLPSRRALYDMVHRHEGDGFPVLRCGRRLLFDQADLKKWMARR